MEVDQKVIQIYIRLLFYFDGKLLGMKEII